MFRERIKETYNDLSAGYRTVADFLLDHPFDAALMTASNIAKRLDIDTATVVRFAQRLGYEGFPELLEDVRTIVRAEIQRRVTPPEEAPGEVGLFRRTIEFEHRNLEELAAGLDDNTIQALLAAISDAQRILIIGQWAMEPLGEFFAMWLRVLGKSVRCISADMLSAAYTFGELSDQDTVLAFALNGLGTEMVNTLQVAKTTGARIVVFAANRSQAAARIANVEIVCPAQSVETVASFTSMAAAMMALLNVLITRNAEAYANNTAAFQQKYQALLDGYRQLI